MNGRRGGLFDFLFGAMAWHWLFGDSRHEDGAHKDASGAQAWGDAGEESYSESGDQEVDDGGENSDDDF